MKESLFHNVVNKLSKTQWKIINNDTIKQIIKKRTDEEVSDSKIYKLTHHLRNKWFLINIKKNHFLCTNPKKIQDEDEIIQWHYRELVKKHCQTYIQWWRYIGGIKALELHLQNYEIPDTLEVVNSSKNACEIIMFQKSICYKTYWSNKSNVFSKSKKLLITQKIGKFSFPCANIELAMLESLHSPNNIDRKSVV